MKTKVFVTLFAMLATMLFQIIPSAQALSPKFPLSTSGNKIIDSSGAQVILQGTEWKMNLGLSLD
jgi:hypothetical protein